jgi:phenylpropionate dioxygenase-like ring-hydroxylating dioxygenase large terminal subunit
MPNPAAVPVEKLIPSHAADRTIWRDADGDPRYASGVSYEPRLHPPPTKGHISVARLTDYWYVALESKELGRRPVQRTILGTPLALFRDGEGRAAALLDRCPHRNVPLSLGRMHADGNLECRYHGWRFDGQGHCRAIPGLCGDRPGRAHDATAYPVREQDGLVWVYMNPEAETPLGEPFDFARREGYTTVRGTLDVEGTLHATLENILDVPHTAYLHRGLFRKQATTEIEAIVRRGPDRVEAEFLGEPRPPGIAARLLSPSGGTVEHTDRFVLPSIAQVEYRLGEENHFLITQTLTPIADHHTRIFADISFSLRIPGWMLRPVLTPIAWAILRQDAFILREQTENVRRFGGEQYAHTSIDLLGRPIWRLLREAERGELRSVDAATESQRVRMTV